MSRKSRSGMPPQEFGRRLQQLMLTKNWNQSDLARAAELGRDSISTYVNGKTFPTPVALKKLAHALSMEPDELLPNTIMNEMNDEQSAFEFRSVVGHPDKAWVRVNQALSFDAATRIAAIINENNKR